MSVWRGGNRRDKFRDPVKKRRPVKSTEKAITGLHGTAYTINKIQEGEGKLRKELLNKRN